MSIYLIKPRFQSLLRPAVAALHAAGVNANQVTLAACAASVVLGLGLYFGAGSHPAALALIPLWMFLRMAFNAADGMLAREFGQSTRLGALLNELTDVVSDAAPRVCSPRNVWRWPASCFFRCVSASASPRPRVPPACCSLPCRASTSLSTRRLLCTSPWW